MTNEQIKKDVIDNLYWDTRVDASKVNVEVDEGKVILTGTVPSYTASSAATSNAWSIEGVIDADNRLTVKYPSGITVPSDSEIKSNIESSLLWDTDVDSTDIDVSVTNNAVTLEGTVDAYWKRYRAENLADVTGVYSMVNKIAVVPSDDVEDKTIAQDIVSALTRNVNVNSDNVEVEVQDGEVTLRGEVSSWTEYNSAHETAYFTAGVSKVENLMTIRY